MSKMVQGCPFQQAFRNLNYKLRSKYTDPNKSRRLAKGKKYGGAQPFKREGNFHQPTPSLLNPSQVDESFDRAPLALDDPWALPDWACKEEKERLKGMHGGVNNNTELVTRSLTARERSDVQTWLFDLFNKLPHRVKAAIVLLFLLGIVGGGRDALVQKPDNSLNSVYTSFVGEATTTVGGDTTTRNFTSVYSSFPAGNRRTIKIRPKTPQDLTIGKETLLVINGRSGRLKTPEGYFKPFGPISNVYVKGDGDVTLHTVDNTKFPAIIFGPDSRGRLTIDNNSQGLGPTIVRVVKSPRYLQKGLLDVVQVVVPPNNSDPLVVYRGGPGSSCRFVTQDSEGPSVFYSSVYYSAVVTFSHGNPELAGLSIRGYPEDPSKGYNMDLETRGPYPEIFEIVMSTDLISDGARLTWVNTGDKPGPTELEVLFVDDDGKVVGKKRLHNPDGSGINILQIEFEKEREEPGGDQAFAFKVHQKEFREE